MKLAAVVVSYNYSNEQLFENVKNYISNVELLIIWDNTPSNKKQLNDSYWVDKRKPVVILSTGKNEGIGYGLNRAIQYAKDSNCTHILTMDQDSVWRDFVGYRATIENDNEENVALYAPTIADADSDFVYRCNKPDLYAITSGSIVNIDIAYRIGLFNEKFFIDEVDNEYCVRAVKNGYHIKVYDNCFLYQQFGEKQKSLFGRNNRGGYSATRTFYQVRNRIWMWKLYPNNLSYKYHLRTILVTILQRLWYILLYEHQKISKIGAILKGITKGLSKSPR